MLKMLPRAVVLIAEQRTAGASLLPFGSEHEVIDDQWLPISKRSAGVSCPLRAADSNIQLRLGRNHIVRDIQ
jgi:hypothetical protein